MTAAAVEIYIKKQELLPVVCLFVCLFAYVFVFVFFL
jgi:hypothetical protein